MKFLKVSNFTICSFFEVGKVSKWCITEWVNFADEKLDVAQMMIDIYGRIENIVGKGRMSVTSIPCFSHYIFPTILRSTG